MLDSEMDLLISLRPAIDDDRYVDSTPIEVAFEETREIQFARTRRKPIFETAKIMDVDSEEIRLHCFPQERWIFELEHSLVLSVRQIEPSSQGGSSEFRHEGLQLLSIGNLVRRATVLDRDRDLEAHRILQDAVEAETDAVEVP